VAAVSPRRRISTAAVDQAAQLRIDGHPAAALQSFELILKKDPRNQDALMGVALSLHDLGRPDEARQAIENWCRVVFAGRPGTNAAQPCPHQPPPAGPTLQDDVPAPLVDPVPAWKQAG
jgi:hypothetical protein